MYNRETEKMLEKEGVNTFAYVSAFKPYVESLKMRREALRSGDESMFRYVFSIPFDREKHEAHNMAVKTVTELNAKCVELGYQPIFSGDLHNRQEIGKFACEFSGEGELAKFAD